MSCAPPQLQSQSGQRGALLRRLQPRFAVSQVRFAQYAKTCPDSLRSNSARSCVACRRASPLSCGLRPIQYATPRASAQGKDPPSGGAGSPPEGGNLFGRRYGRRTHLAPVRAQPSTDSQTRYARTVRAFGALPRFAVNRKETTKKRRSPLGMGCRGYGNPCTPHPKHIFFVRCQGFASPRKKPRALDTATARQARTNNNG